MKSIYIVGALFLFFQVSFSQSVFKGTLDEWNGDTGEIIVGFMDPTIIGHVDNAGHFEIPLVLDYLEEAKKQVEDENKNSKDGWSTSLITLEKAFSCYTDSLSIQNGDKPIGKLSMMGVFTLVNMEKKKRFGSFMVASSKEFAESILDYAAYQVQKGYYLDWYFVDEDGSVNGNCTIDSYALNQEEMYTSVTHYNLQFKKGWNILKYEVTELFTDRDGHTYPQEVTYSVLEEVPDGTVYAFLLDKN